MDHPARSSGRRAARTSRPSGQSVGAAPSPVRADRVPRPRVPPVLVARARAAASVGQSACPPAAKGPRMPNYLSPGVYVEEVEAGSRPIEGVGTAVAAFVGLAAHGPDQHADARHELEPVRSARSATSSRARTWPTPSTATSSTAAARPTSCASAPTARCRRHAPSSTSAKDKDARRPTASSALEAGPAATRSPSRSSGRRPRRPRTRSSSRSTSGGQADETYDNVTTKKGKQNVVTIVKAQSKLIQIEEIGRAGALERVPATGTITLTRRRDEPSRSGSRRTTTSATRPIAPASAASRRSTRSRCSPCPT